MYQCQHVTSSFAVVEAELAKNLGALSAGCLTYKKNTKQSAEAFAKRTDVSGKSISVASEVNKNEIDQDTELSLKELTRKQTSDLTVHF